MTMKQPQEIQFLAIFCKILTYQRLIKEKFVCSAYIFLQHTQVNPDGTIWTYFDRTIPEFIVAGNGGIMAKSNGRPALTFGKR